MSRRPDGTWRYDDPAWRAVRLQVLHRDGGMCQIRRGDGCTLTATEVDHIVPVADGGQLLDPDNLRAACRWCNRGRRPSTSKHVTRPICRFDGVPAASVTCDACGYPHRPSRAW